MSLSIDNPYNAHLRKMISEMGDGPSDVANYPEMIYGGTRPQKNVTPESLAYANPLHDVLVAEKQLSVDYGMEGGSVLGDLKKEVKKAKKSVEKGAKKTVKTVKKAGESIEKGAKKVAKSKVGKAVGKVGKAVGTAVLDEGEKLSGPAGAALGTALATATGNPELAPVAAAIGAKVAKSLGSEARKGIKKATGMGRPKSAWLLHVAEYRKANGGSYKDAMKNAKATYKK
jgi:hypothetical protein